MSNAESEFAFGVEMECLTVVAESRFEKELTISHFFTNLATQAPSLPTYRGFFNAYGRCYFDVGHVELATSECASPYMLPSIVDRIQTVAVRAVEALRQSHERIVLANNNHSGLLSDGCPVWGTHENYLLEKNPESLGDFILPFLVSRIYAGAGGVYHPSGDYVAGVRPYSLAVATGGGTTDCRAIHCTVGRPNHAETSPKRYRYHLISGDGHRSQFNWSLQFGATALATKAAIYDAKTRAAARQVRVGSSSNWIGMMRQFNFLAAPGQMPHVDPQVIALQRIYLDGARRFAKRLESPPEWIPRLLTDWEDTLDAYQRMDRDWLAARLDAFAKYELFSAVLQDAGCTWSQLPNRQDLFHELALLNQNYHEFSNSESAFSRLDNAGLLQHRVAPHMEPGEEPDPFVPETGTRAAARARLIKENKDAKNLSIDWAIVHDSTTGRHRELHNPFATEYGPWTESPDVRTVPNVSDALQSQRALDLVLRHYDQGRFRSAHMLLSQMERTLSRTTTRTTQQHTMLRYHAWVRPRLGTLDGLSLLESVHREQMASWTAIGDHCNVLRYTGLSPDPERMSPWLQRGLSLLESLDSIRTEPTEAPIIREHIAAALVNAGQLDHAQELLSKPSCRRHTPHRDIRIRARLLAVRAELYRKQGRHTAAARLLNVVRNVQRQCEFIGQLVNYTIPCLAKAAARPEEALAFLDEGQALASRNSDRISQLRIALLRCRIAGDGPHVADTLTLAQQLHHDLPTLRECRVMTRIVDNWNLWLAGDMLAGETDRFWGV